MQESGEECRGRLLPDLPRKQVAVAQAEGSSSSAAAEAAVHLLSLPKLRCNHKHILHPDLQENECRLRKQRSSSSAVAQGLSFF